VTVVISVLRDLLGDAAAEGMIQTAPVMPGRGRARHAPVFVRPGRALELATVLRACARLDQQSALMVLVAVFTGMRWGEVSAMRCAFLHVPEPGAADAPGQRAWYEVDARLGAVHEDVHARRFFGPPKGGHGRVVDLPPFLAALLARHVRATGGRELLFVNSRGEPIRHSDWLGRWHRACDGTATRGVGRRQRAGPCPGARFHDLRHSHATMLAELGVPEVLRDDRLGHHPPGVRALYTHTTTPMRAAMIQALESLWQEAAAHTEAEAAGVLEGRQSDVSRARCGRTMAAD
jgi:integrase